MHQVPLTGIASFLPAKSPLRASGAPGLELLAETRRPNRHGRRPLADRPPPRTSGQGLNQRLTIGASLGGELRTARTQAGIGLREAARKLGISHSYLVMLEHGERAPGLWLAKRLTRLLGLPPSTAVSLETYGVAVERGRGGRMGNAEQRRAGWD